MCKSDDVFIQKSKLKKTAISTYAPWATHKKVRIPINLIIKRHEIFRTVFPPTNNGGSFQKILPSRMLDVPLVSLRAVPDQDVEKTLSEIITFTSLEKYPFESVPPFDCVIYELKQDQHLLVCYYSHLVFDRWTQSIFYHEFIELYCSKALGITANLEDPKFQFKDYAIWKRRFLTGDNFNTRYEYWKQLLLSDNTPPKSPILVNSPSQEEEINEIRPEFFEIPRETAAGIRSLSKRLEVTPYLCYLTSFSRLLARYASDERVSILVPMSVDREIPESHDMPGDFVDHVCLRLDVPHHQDFKTHVSKIKQAVIDSANNSLPISLLNLPASHFPAVSFNMHNVPPVTAFPISGVKNPLTVPSDYISGYQVPELGIHFNATSPRERRARWRFTVLKFVLTLVETPSATKGTIYTRTDLKYIRPTTKDFIADYLDILRSDSQGGNS